MLKNRTILLWILMVCIYFPGQPVFALESTTFFNQQWLKSVVSIEQEREPDKNKPIGTGFLIMSRQKKTLLVTAKHVILSDKNKIKPNLLYRINRVAQKSYLVKETFVQKMGGGDWFLANDSDVAVRFLFHQKDSDIIHIPLDALIQKDYVQAGTPALILGFPMGLRSKNYATPIVRKAIVALNDPDRLLIDGFAFPGNSGGPVVYMPAYQGKGAPLTNYIEKQKLIGLMSSYIPYRDVAISNQTNRPRIIFEEHSGLSVVVSADEIIKLINRRDFLDLEEKLLHLK